MSIEMDILYQPDEEKIKLPKFHQANIVLNSAVVPDPNTPAGFLGEIKVGDTFELQVDSYVYLTKDSTKTEVPLNSDNDTYRYQKYHSIQPLGSLPSSLQFVETTNGLKIHGTIYNADKPLYQFLLRVTLEVYDKTSGAQVRVDVYERYFYFTTAINQDTFYWDPNWLDSQMVKVVDDQTIYWLGSWPRGQNISIPTSLYNPNNLAIHYSAVPTGFTSDLASMDSILPQGLRINELLGSIDGSISISNDPGMFYFKIQAADGDNLGNPPTTSVIFAIQVQSTIDTNTTPNDSIIWVTPSGSLGSTYSTYASHFSVRARNPKGQAVSYSLSPSSAALPGGLSIDTDTGDILGSCPFVPTTEEFQIKIRATVNANYSDRLFSFTVVSLFLSESYLTINIPITEKIRNLVTSWAWNTTAIPDSQVFRITDFNFSRTINPQLLVTSGLNNTVQSMGYWYNNPNNQGGSEPANGTISQKPDLTTTEAKYWNSIFLDKLRGYHRSFPLRIGTVSWAPGYDPTGNYVYDMVYLNIFDPNSDATAFSNGVEQLYINPTSSLENQSFLSNIDEPHSEFQIPNSETSREYPVCLQNCRNDLILRTNRVTSPTYYQAPNSTPGIGLNGGEGLPFWMKDSKNSDSSPIGWVAAIPLVYCTPGTGSTAVVNLKQLGLENQLTGQTFTVDRYIVTSTTEKWIIWDPTMNPTTTFDDITVPDYDQTLFDAQMDYHDQVILFPKSTDYE